MAITLVSRFAELQAQHWTALTVFGADPTIPLILPDASLALARLQAAAVMELASEGYLAIVPDLQGDPAYTITFQGQAALEWHRDQMVDEPEMDDYWGER